MSTHHALVTELRNQIAKLEGGVTIERISNAYLGTTRGAVERQRDELEKERDALTAEVTALREEQARIYERREPTFVDAETDNAQPAVVRLALLECLRAWEPTARVLGNVRAWDAERAIVEIQDRCAAHERDRDALTAEVTALQEERDERRCMCDFSNWTLANRTAPPVKECDYHLGLRDDLSDARAECTTLRERLERQTTALRPFARFAEQWNRKPIRGLDDEIYAIHTGTEYEASLRVSECQEARRALEDPPRRLDDGTGA